MSLENPKLRRAQLSDWLGHVEEIWVVFVIGKASIYEARDV